MSIWQTFYGFLIAIPPLIIIHELGHFLVARWCGVKVLRFSIGFGRVLWSRRFGRHGTEWAISLLPLGGYVSMLDKRFAETPIAAADMAQEFTSQPVGKRIAIVAAGPVTNFLLAIVLYAGLNMHGVLEVPNRMRVPDQGSAAALAGFEGGDRIAAVNGKATAGWGEVRMALMQAAIDRSNAVVQVERNGGKLQLNLPAARFAGLELDSDIPGELGFVETQPRAELASIVAGGVAEKAGLLQGDLVVEAAGRPVRDALDLRRIIHGHGARPLPLTVERGGQALNFSVVPVVDQAKGRAMIGVGLMAPERMLVRSGPVDAVAKAVARTWDLSVMSLRLIGKMVVGEVSLKNVTGPITMGDYAGQTAQAGLVVFLGYLAFLSTSLGVMNLLPIPVLDGGHLLYYLVEVLTGRPLPERIGEYAQRAGFGLLVMLMALAIFNDIARRL